MNAAETSPFCRMDVAGTRATLTLDRPESRNALSARMVDELLAGLRDALDDDAVRVVVLTGTGRAFCSGADLKEQRNPERRPKSGIGVPPIVRVLELIQSAPKPVLARVNGHVAGGGNGLVAACDLAVAVDTATFAFSEVKVGVAPAIISVVCLPRLRASDAAELMLLGQRIDADRAQRIGLVNRVVTAADMDAQIDALVTTLAANGPTALAATKELLKRVPGMRQSDAFSWTARLSKDLFASDEAQEGMAAFAEKRAPRWSSGI